MWAAQEGHIETCQILIEFGAKAGVKDENGRTALDIAKRQGHEAVAEMIADADARQKVRRRPPRKRSHAACMGALSDLSGTVGFQWR